jgi:O-antigen/teichoic acid export membrane protein
MASAKQFKYGVVLSYIVIIFNILSGLLYTPWMISKIGKADYGLYILVTSFLAYFTVDYGLYQAVNKMVAERIANKDFVGEQKVINVATTIYVALDILILLALLFAYNNIETIYTNLTNDELRTFYKLFVIASSFVLFSFPLVFLKGIFMAREYFVVIKSFDMLQKILLIVLTVTCLFLDLGVVSLVIAYGLAPFISRICQYIYLRRKGIKFKVGVFDKYITKEMFTISVWLFIFVFSQMLITNIAPSLLAKYTDTTQIAIFAIGISLYNYVYAFAGAINGFFLPKIFKLKSKNENERIVQLSAMASAVQLYVVGLFIFGLYVVGKEFITLWVGDSFLSAWYICLCLLAPCLISFSQAVEHQELFAENKLWCSSVLKICSAVSSISLGIWLIPKFQAIGCAIAIGTSVAIFEVIGLNIIYFKVMKHSRIPYLKIFVKYIFSTMLAVVIFKLTTSHIWVSYSWPNLLLQCMYFFVIYTILAYFIAIPGEVKNFVLKPILSKIHRN